MTATPDPTVAEAVATLRRELADLTDRRNRIQANRTALLRDLARAEERAKHLDDEVVVHQHTIRLLEQVAP